MESVARAVSDYKGSKAFEVNAVEVEIELYALGFEACKEAVVASFLGLDLQAVFLPNGGGGKKEEEVERAEVGEAASIELPPTVRDA